MLNIPMLILLPLWLALIPFHALAASGLTVKLLDHISEAGLAGQEVHAYEKGGDGSLVWKTKRVTDGGGLAKFDLEGLGEGKTYVFNAQPYGYWVKSEEVTATGWYSFRVGHLQVRVIDGVTEQPKAGQAVVLKRWQADGNHVGVMNATTDAEGWLKLDPPNLGQVGYVVTAISPTDGQWKTSETYWVKGPHRFVLGNAVVEAKLRDGISGEGLAGQWMEVWEKLSTGNRVLREKRWTDGTGSIKFDLAGMKEGRRYVLKAQPYLDAVESGEISQSGPQELKAGKLRITLVDGRDGQGYGWRDVDLLERQADGSLKGVRSYKTDGEGRLRLDPAQLGVKDQVIRAVSLVDGSVKESPGYARGGDYSFKVGGPGLTVKLLDHISEAGLAGQEVHAYEKGGDGSLVWKTKRVTDGGGLAKFDLEGLGEGKTYVFNAQPYGYWVKSEEVTATGWYSFRVGHLQVRVIDGVTEQPKAGQAVVLKRWQADGNHVGVMNATTDAEGWLKLDPPNLGQVGYVVTAISPTDGQWKTSETYWVKGPHRFVLGNAVVEAKLRDGISGEGLAGQWMEVWEKLSTGNRVLREKRWTDGTGSIKFDLAGMKEGRRYVLKAQPYLDAVESGEISQSGPQELKAGKLRITLVDGRDGQGYGWRDVDLLERQADGSLKGVRSYKTDGEGRLRLDPAQLGVKDQVIRAVSLVDGSVKESPGYARGGDYSFKVGGPGLTVKLLDHISEAGLAGQEVHAYEKGGDGSLVWKTKRVTDGGGLAKFDLEGLGEGKTYVFNAQPYGYWVKSEEVTATGWYSFRVGHLQVRVIDGVTEQPKAGQAVVLKRWQADGNHVGVMNATTDAEGWLKLDPPNLGQVGYVVTAISPTDGQWKTSETYWVKGPHRFVLGNAVVEAKLRDGISGEGLAGQWMEVWEKLSTGNRVLREKRWTDGTGSIKFDLAGMKEGRRYVLKAQPYLDAVESGEISQSGPQELKAGKLRITLVDGRDGQGYGWRDVDLLERQADGSLKGVRSYKTDGEGRLRLDPAQLGVKDQVIRAVSLVDGSVKESPGYARGGDYSFKVGGPGLTVKLLDHISEAGLAGQEVHAYEKGGDGSLVWKTKRVTDGGGLAKFDLEGLGEGKTYVFNAQPYGYWVKSEEVTATGWYSFRVGHLQVRVIDGVTEQPKAGQAVVLKRWQADGNHVGVMNATTDAEGWLKLDPPNLGQVGYVVTAISPTDGQWKTSETYWVKGPHRFVLGNAVVEAKLRDGISGEGLAGQWMEVWEKLSTGNRVLREKRWTDGTGSIKFDLAGMKEGRRYVLKAQPYLDAVESGEISQSGPQELKAGKLRITLVDGRDGQGYGWRDVDLLERQADGSLKGVRSYKTDGEGRLRLDPAQLGVKDQVIRAVSLVDGSVKESPGYARGGDYSFKVGGPGLTVKLLDHISEAGLAGQEVHAYEKGGDGSLVWKTKRVTDGGGLAKFDLEGLGEGKTYVFNAQPYGYWVKSEEVTAAGWYSFRVGTTLLTLQDSSPSQPLSNQRVIALEKLSNGNLRWERETVTDAQGQARFDLTGLGKGATYLFKAVNPFGDGKDYFSNLLTWRGAYLFSLDSTRQNTPDQTPPEVAIAFPGPAAAVSRGGFALYGSASDDKAIKSVRAVLTLPSGAVLERPAVYQSDLWAWRVETGALDTAGLAAPGTLAVRVVATDTGLNEAEARVDLSLLADITPPVLTVLSHQDGGMVPMGGFVVSGRVTDDTLGPRLEARVEGGGLTAAEVREVEVSSANGAWAVRVAPEAAFSTVPITLTLTARDGADNRVVETLHLQPTDDYQQAWHVLRRVSFGATPGQTRSLVETGVQDYLARQLVPGAVDDSAFTQRSASWLDRGAYLSTDYLRHAVYSQRQLQEVMTWFWENHFNTTYGKHNNPEYEYREQEGFRAHALGNFRDLLEVSAKSPAMLYSLDGVTNMKNRPNENYARELFELNTLGITGGYSQQDVVEAARAFTGWTVVDGQFAFNAGAHDGGAKTVLGMAIPAGGGLSDGEAVLDLVAVHPSTASFICGKLVTLFVSDTPVQALAQRCAATFLRNVGATDQMAKVVWTILSSEEFLGGTYRGAKVKTPLELVVGLTRNLAGETGGDDLALELQRLEMGMFVNPLPTGYAEVGKPWISTGMLLNRVNFLDRALNSAPAAGGTGYDLGGLMANAGLETAEGVVGRMLDLILGPTWTRRHWDLGMSLLTESGVKPYWHWATESENRLRSLGKGLSAMPEYQFQ